MAYGLSPYAYRPGKTFLHRLPAGLKLLGLLLISLGAFSYPGVLFSLGMLLAGALAARLPPWALLRGIKPLLFMIGLVIILRSFHFKLPYSLVPALSLSGLWAGIRFGGGITLSFCAGSLLFSVTTMTALKDSLGRAETLLRTCWYWLITTMIGKPRPRATRNSPVSLGISLMLTFLPRFFEVWEEAELAYRARAGKKGLPALILLIPLVSERMIAMAVETACAMESRGASLEAVKSHVKI
ncbi:MAG: energy-coupling factor transporter transmembrane protein EcfT [Treponema sp.]|jgi:biotin transport system permease protein|nr:energy-coupling factor transporter transmembrane protein EcfT [Treponema sp.]